MQMNEWMTIGHPLIFYDIIVVLGYHTNIGGNMGKIILGIGSVVFAAITALFVYDHATARLSTRYFRDDMPIKW